MSYSYDPAEGELYLACAELFFLDTEVQAADYQRVAQQLVTAGWDEHKLNTILIEWIAPVMGANIGWLFWPVIGEWSGFDQDELQQKMLHHIQKRQRRLKVVVLLQDYYCRRMLKKLEVDRLYREMGRLHSSSNCNI